MHSAFEKSIQALKKGKIVLLLDDCSNTFAAHLLASASSISAKDIAFMVNIGRGVIVSPISEKRSKELFLPPMSPSQSRFGEDFTVSVEARHEVTTGISAADRAQTLKVLATTTDARLDLVMPGHIFPIRTKKGGVLVRTAPAEAAIDLVSQAQLPQVAVTCECLNQEGERSNIDEINQIAAHYKLPVIKITDIVRYRLAHEKIVEKIATSTLPTLHGEFSAVCFKSKIDDSNHLALVKGDISAVDSQGLQIPLLCRVQAENLTEDLLEGISNSSRSRLDLSLKAIEKEQRGIFVYIRNPSDRKTTKQFLIASNSPSEIKNSIHDSRNPIHSRLHEIGIGAQILRALGASRIKLLTSATVQPIGIDAFQIEITEQISLSFL